MAKQHFQRQAYAKAKQRAKVRSAAITLAGQDIAPLPKVASPARRARADRDFRNFCETYFPHLFTLAWSRDRLRIIARIERVVGHREPVARHFRAAAPKHFLGPLVDAEVAGVVGIHGRQQPRAVAPGAQRAHTSSHGTVDELWGDDLGHGTRDGQGISLAPAMSSVRKRDGSANRQARRPCR